MARRTKSESSDFSDYVDRELFTGADGKMDHWRDVKWIYENLEVDVSESDAPSIGAWTWLREVRCDADAKKKFRDYYMKLAPSRSELDERSRSEEDGRGVLELIAAVERAMGGGY